LSGPHPPSGRRWPGRPQPALDRRRFLRLAGLAGAGLGLGSSLSGCNVLGLNERAAGPRGRTITIGFVSPQSGQLAAFGEADNYVLGQVRERLADGLEMGGNTYPVDIVVGDSQSDPDRAQQVATSLIGRQIDMMVVASTPEITNPVASLCESNGVPCISTIASWQTWFLGRGGNPDKPFKWTFHFFWGLEDAIRVYTDMWGQVPHNKTIGALWPDDAAGKAWADRKRGFPATLVPDGYEIIDPGRYASQSSDFTPQLERFKDAGADILTGVPTPPDMATIWKQANDIGYRPRIVTAGRAPLFPAFIEAMSPNAEGLSTELWWSPTYPFRSSLTGQTATELGSDYTRVTERQWTQPLGFVHALFEVAMRVFQLAGTPEDKTAITEATRTLVLDTVVGHLDFNRGPVPGVAKTPLSGGQWRRGTDFPFEISVVSSVDPAIQSLGDLRPILGF
jgi:branched-chain amino acid transport system substrate-binding protein